MLGDVCIPLLFEYSRHFRYTHCEDKVEECGLVVDYATAYVYLVSALARSERADSGGIASIQEPGRLEGQYIHTDLRAV